jgi:glycosyltransferase involved in cell wall biosynthesis
VNTGAPSIRVLLVTANLDTGGVEELIRTLIAGLDRSRFEIAIAFLKTGTVAGEIAKFPDVRSYYIASTSRIVRFFRFWKIARTFRPHVVHNHACWYGLLIGFLAGARRIETVHNCYQWFRPHERLLYGLYCLLANRMIAVSRNVRDFTVKFFPFIRTGILSVVPNAVDVRKFFPLPETTALRNALAITSEEVVIGFIGRLTEQKGIPYLLEALNTLIPPGPPIHCIIIGTGDLEDDLRRQAREVTTARVSFPGFRRDVPACLGLFDIFVLPSLWEGLPMGLLEAMAAERPVVATAVGGSSEAVADGETGYLVEPRNVQQLADRLRTLINDPDLRKRMGSAGRKRVESLYAAEQMVSSTEALYIELTKSP